MEAKAKSAMVMLRPPGFSTISPLAKKKPPGERGERPGHFLLRVTREYRLTRIAEHKDITHDQPTVQHFSYNMLRNRYRNIPLFDDTRVVLTHNGKKGASNDSTYIHASWVGKETKEPLILTQGPLPKAVAPPSDGTVSDFWRMIYQNHVNCIVCLCAIEDEKSEESAQYWNPRPGKTFPAKPYSKIETQKVEEKLGWRESELQLTFKTEGKGLFAQKDRRKVVHFYMNEWDEKVSGIPHLGALLKLCDSIYETNEAMGYLDPAKAAPVVIHCSSGAKRSGLFAAMYLCVCEIRGMFGRVDPAAIAKRVKTSRYGTINNKGQFMDVYRSAVEYACLHGDLKRNDPVVANFIRVLESARKSVGTLEHDPTEHTADSNW